MAQNYTYKTTDQFLKTLIEEAMGLNPDFESETEVFFQMRWNKDKTAFTVEYVGFFSKTIKPKTEKMIEILDDLLKQCRGQFRNWKRYYLRGGPKKTI